MNHAITLNIGAESKNDSFFRTTHMIAWLLSSEWHMVVGDHHTLTDHIVKSKLYFSSRKRKQKINIFFKAKDNLLGNVCKEEWGRTSQPLRCFFFFYKTFHFQRRKAKEITRQSSSNVSGKIIKLEEAGVLVLSSNPNSGRDTFY
jgi:hypothetical protein